jgi:hypothetical protein
MAGSLGSEPHVFPRAADRTAVRAVESVQLFGHMQCLAGSMAHIAFAFNFGGNVTQAVHVSLSTIRCGQPVVWYKKFDLRPGFGRSTRFGTLTVREGRRSMLTITSRIRVRQRGATVRECVPASDRTITDARLFRTVPTDRTVNGADADSQMLSSWRTHSCVPRRHSRRRRPRRRGRRQQRGRGLTLTARQSVSPPPKRSSQEVLLWVASEDTTYFCVCWNPAGIAKTDSGIAAAE